MHLFQQIEQGNSTFKCVRLVRHIHFRKYTEPSLDGTVYSAATEEDLLGKTHFFLSLHFMRIKIGSICQISHEGRKTAVLVGMLREYCVLLPLESDKRGNASDISARRSGGLSPDRFSYL